MSYPITIVLPSLYVESGKHWIYDPREKTYVRGLGRVCNFPLCRRGHFGLGLCQAHYRQLNTTNSLKPIRKGQTEAKCKGFGCERTHYADGYCRPCLSMDFPPLQVDEDKAYGLCIVISCDKEMKNDKLRMCADHVHEHNLRLRANDIHEREKSKPCDVSGCDEPATCMDMCRKHYLRYMKYGTTDLPPRGKKGCKVEGCYNRHKGKGFCRQHLYENHRKGKPDRRVKNRICDEPGCGKKHKAKGKCKDHYESLRKAALKEATCEKTPATA